MRPGGSALGKRDEESISNLSNLSTEKKKDISPARTEDLMS